LQKKGTNYMHRYNSYQSLTSFSLSLSCSTSIKNTYKASFSHFLSRSIEPPSRTIPHKLTHSLCHSLVEPLSVTHLLNLPRDSLSLTLWNLRHARRKKAIAVGTSVTHSPHKGILILSQFVQ